MALNKAYVGVEFPEDFREIVGKLNAVIQEESLAIAEEVAADAQGTLEFRDYTGTSRETEWHKRNFPNATRLRPNIKARKSKYPDGGAIVIARAPHAHLVEFGHVMVKNGKVLGSVPAHPFLRPAVSKRLQEAIQRIGRAIQEGLGE